MSPYETTQQVPIIPVQTSQTPVQQPLSYPHHVPPQPISSFPPRPVQPTLPPQQMPVPQHILYQQHISSSPHQPIIQPLQPTEDLTPSAPSLDAILDADVIAYPARRSFTTHDQSLSMNASSPPGPSRDVAPARSNATGTLPDLPKRIVRNQSVPNLSNGPRQLPVPPTQTIMPGPPKPPPRAPSSESIPSLPPRKQTQAVPISEEEKEVNLALDALRISMRARSQSDGEGLKAIQQELREGRLPHYAEPPKQDAASSQRRSSRPPLPVPPVRQNVAF